MSVDPHLLVTAAITAAEAGDPPPPALKHAVNGRLSDSVRAAALAAEPSAAISTLSAVDKLVAESVGMLRRNRAAGPCGRHTSDSAALLAQAVGLLGRIANHPLVYSVGRASVANAMAYLNYVRERYDDAVAALEDANIASLVLVQGGYRAQHCARLQHLHNFARVTLRRGDPGTAFRLAETMLCHLCGGDVCDVPLSGPWTASLVEACPSELTAYFAYQVAGERAYWRYRLSPPLG